jgi:hypothetical protein
MKFFLTGNHFYEVLFIFSCLFPHFGDERSTRKPRNSIDLEKVYIFPIIAPIDTYDSSTSERGIDGLTLGFEHIFEWTFYVRKNFIGSVGLIFFFIVKKFSF